MAKTVCAPMPETGGVPDDVMKEIAALAQERGFRIVALTMVPRHRAMLHAMTAEYRYEDISMVPRG